MSESKRKVVLVTGSAGVGRACAVRFASMGFDAVVNYPGVDEEEAKRPFDWWKPRE